MGWTHGFLPVAQKTRRRPAKPAASRGVVVLLVFVCAYWTGVMVALATIGLAIATPLWSWYTVLRSSTANER